MNGSTQLVGIIGWPVSHSKSPAMHNAAFDALKLNWAYVPMPVRDDNVESALKGLQALGFKGANVTVPHKEKVFPFLDQVTQSARAIGAVNTITITEDQKLIGDNTDAYGFIMDLQGHSVDIKNTSALILGAGGSSRAVLYGLLEAGCPELVVMNRTLDKAERMVAEIALHFSDTNIKTCILDATNLQKYRHLNLVINCTSLGLGQHANEMAWDSDVRFTSGQIVYDLLYSPNPTQLLQKARDEGATPISGIGMLVHQGARSFEIWTGHKAPVAIMRKTVLSLT